MKQILSTLTWVAVINAMILLTILVGASLFKISMSQMVIDLLVITYGAMVSITVVAYTLYKRLK